MQTTFGKKKLLTFTRGNSEQSFNDFPINKAIIDGEDMNILGFRR